MSILLGINIDHVATLRQARGTRYPDPIAAAHEAELGGADSITIHLREDQRHIQPRDVELLKQTLQVPMNLEMAVTPRMLDFASQIRPEKCCFVPEKREELTTEGGLDVAGNFERVKEAVASLSTLGCEVSLFIEADEAQILAAAKTGAQAIEIHTGHYADATTPKATQAALQKVILGAQYAHTQGLIVNAGHGLHYHNIQSIVLIPHLHELNIGHAIVARALHCGMQQAVREMKRCLVNAGL